ncbi:DUF7832 domain-containing protein [Mycolicibacterium neoaurum]|uniref:DUF7832 domain-containing protein n=1 Tax=Mycolicibacterium neoaurum TaxID=1795 RepID=UPI001F4C6152|nr:hypothetical protein [Mycolicibacterium neoaurum]
MPIDDAGWHYDTCSEHELDYTCAGTHIGIFLAWLAYHSLTESDSVDFSPLLNRSITPGAFLMQHCCGEISGFLLTAEGLAFGNASYRTYLNVLDRIPEIARYPVTYAAPDTWETYDAVAPVISEIYQMYSTHRQQV